VRLRQFDQACQQLAGDTFQSYHSAIKAGVPIFKLKNENRYFNPTIVRLRLANTLPAIFIKYYFNPTIVRLRPIGKRVKETGGNIFQSYHSAIKAPEYFATGGILFEISILP